MPGGVAGAQSIMIAPYADVRRSCSVAQPVITIYIHEICDK